MPRLELRKKSGHLTDREGEFESKVISNDFRMWG